MAPPPRALCHECGKEVPIRDGGELRQHRPMEGWPKDCPGSGQPHRELETVCGRPVHPAAAVLPLMDGEEFEDLVEDIRQHGQRERVVLRGELVVDGRNRLRALERLGIEPRVTTRWADVDDVWSFVKSVNLHRRHLSATAKALAAARLLPLERAAGRERMAEARRGTRTVYTPEPVTDPHPFQPPETKVAPRGATFDDAGVPPSGAADFGSQIYTSQIDPDLAVGKSTEVVAEQFGVSPRSVERAALVVEQGAPELVEAVSRGDVPLATAAELARLPQDEQRKLVQTASPEVLREVARDQVAQQKDEKRRKKELRAAAQGEQARAAAPKISGIDLRCCSSVELIGELHGAGVRLVHADPPWKYRNGGNGAADTHYPTMRVDQILDDLDATHVTAARDALLVIWFTWPLIGELFEHIEDRVQAGKHAWHWGRPVTGGAWSKEGNLAQGHWWGGASEGVLVFVRGSPVVLEKIGNAHGSPRTEHSEKPIGWLTDMVRAWVPVGGLVLDPYAGLGSMARACAATGRRYAGAEIVPARHRLALAELAGATRTELTS